MSFSEFKRWTYRDDGICMIYSFLIEAVLQLPSQKTSCLIWKPLLKYAFKTNSFMPSYHSSTMPMWDSLQWAPLPENSEENSYLGRYNAASHLCMWDGRHVESCAAAIGIPICRPYEIASHARYVSPTKYASVAVLYNSEIGKHPDESNPQTITLWNRFPSAYRQEHLINDYYWNSLEKLSLIREINGCCKHRQNHIERDFIWGHVTSLWA